MLFFWQELRETKRDKDFVSLLRLNERFVWPAYCRYYGLNERDRVQTEFIGLRYSAKTIVRLIYCCNSAYISFYKDIKFSRDICQALLSAIILLIGMTIYYKAAYM
jgi:hypothetical protein